jgi:hypothetical protein
MPAKLFGGVRWRSSRPSGSYRWTDAVVLFVLRRQRRQVTYLIQKSTTRSSGVLSNRCHVIKCGQASGLWFMEWVNGAREE